MENLQSNKDDIQRYKKEYHGSFVVTRKGFIIRSFDTYSEAFQYGLTKYPEKDFMVQKNPKN